MTDKLETELEALRARVAELEARANPPAPPNFNTLGPSGPTTTELAMSRASLSREAMEKMAIPGVRDIFRDARATQNLRPLADANARPRVAQENRSGWANEVPLGPPSGVAIADRLMDMQDAKDRAERIMQHARMKAVEKKEG
jgi:hypothetical protein